MNLSKILPSGIRGYVKTAPETVVAVHSKCSREH